MNSDFDAIVIGTGVSGGWAAKELCENGLKTLVLERGRMINHPSDYTTANMDKWDFPSGDKITNEIRNILLSTGVFNQVRALEFDVNY